MKKIFAVLFALTLILSLSTAVFTTASAADDTKTWTGTITIEGTTTVPVDGKTFNAYKILDAKAVDVNDLSKGVVYSIPENAALQAFYNDLCGDPAPATIDDVMGYLDRASAEELREFAVEALAAAKDAGVDAKASVDGTEENTAEIKNLAFGYYVVEDAGTATPISALMLKTTSEKVVIKADKPSIDKKIDGDSDADETTAGPVDYNTAKVGETVPYVLTSKVPEMKGYIAYTYVVTDTFSDGLTYKYADELKDGVSVTIGGVEYTDFTVEQDGQEITITFTNFINQAAKAGQDIVIKYAATVDTDAVFGTEGNPNKVVLTYSNNPQDGVSTETTPEEKVSTYLVDLVINKTDDKDQPLDGAEFAIFATNDTNKENPLATGVSKNGGLVTFTWANGAALKDGESYTIVETKAPDGFNEAEDITFAVTFDDPTADTAAAWVSSNNKVVYNNDHFEITIKNTTGALLPETGGIGTTIFYTVGGLMMIVAFVLLVSKKRMGNYA